MSTIVAVKKDGIAVIAADTLTKFGGMKQDTDLVMNHSKIDRFGGSYIASVGDCAIGHSLRSYFSRLEEIPGLNTTHEIFEFACNFHKALKEDYYLRPEEDDEDDFESSRFEGLIVNSNGIFGLYALRSVDEYKKYFSFGTGAKFALGAMKALYDQDLTAEEIAIAALEAAAYFDDGTGKPFDVFSVELKQR